MHVTYSKYREIRESVRSALPVTGPDYYWFLSEYSCITVKKIVKVQFIPNIELWQF